MPRRGENIRKRTDGRWEGRYKICKASPGSGSSKTAYHSVYGKTYGEVKEKLTRYKEVSRLQPQSALPGTVEFCEAVEQWLQEIKKTRKHSTYMKYCAVYDRHIKNQLSGIAAKDVNDTIVHRAVIGQDYSSGACISDSLRRSIYCVINQTLSYASVHYQQPQIILKCTSPKRKGKPVEIINCTEQEKLLRYLYGKVDISKLGIILCLSTGLRLGEICALKWQDIDFSQRVLHVNRTVQRIGVDNATTKTVLLESAPKSAYSKRVIPLTEHLARLFSRFYIGYDKGHQDNEGYCLGGQNPMEPRTYQNRFKTYLKKAGVGEYRFHVLRHTFATNCINNGMDVKCLSEILGHSDVRITLNRYVHPTIDTKRKYLENLSSIYGQYCGQDLYASEKDQSCPRLS